MKREELEIEAPSDELRESLQHKLDHLTKPLGSLGKLETMALRLGLIQNTLEPTVTKKRHLVFAADHGITAEGVSAFPAAVTAQMVHNFLGGGAAVNVFGRLNKVDVQVIDVGVDHDFGEVPGLISRKVRAGTRNFAGEAALHSEEVEAALEVGIDLAAQAASEGVQLLSLGEMGIGNTSSATAITCALTGKSATELTCYGTGIDEPQRLHKAKIIEQTLAFHQPVATDALDILSKVGGLEIAAMAGACLGAAANRLATVLDGYISLAGGALACIIEPNTKHYLFASHKGVEEAHRALIDLMEIDDFLDLDMRLGEGTGAVLAANILESACRMLSEMATFESANVAEANG